MSDSDRSDKSVKDAEPQVSEAPALPPWQCQLQALDQAGAPPLEKLYVGDKYLLHCHGPFVEGTSKDWHLAAIDEVNSYKVKILEYRTVENQKFWAVVTSYKPGDFSLDQFTWTNNSIKVPLGGGTQTIYSALAERPQEQVNNPESQKMILFGPFALSMPLWYWLLWVALFVGLLGAVYRGVSKRLKRKKILEDLARQSTALTPYNQFQKELRVHMRKFSTESIQLSPRSDYLNALDDSFRMYLLRELLVPAKDWSSSAVMREIKNRHKRVYRTVGPQVRKVLIEFDRAKKDLATVSLQDCEQMREMSRRVVDRVYKMKRLEK
ncbi:MAG: hypothetical protein KDD34_08780 [Bdellovibrionales bacterium]|nr:hypothetical protein [Bdellovibrionales bacterium]